MTAAPTAVEALYRESRMNYTGWCDIGVAAAPAAVHAVALAGGDGGVGLVHAGLGQGDTVILHRYLLPLTATPWGFSY